MNLFLHDFYGLLSARDVLNVAQPIRHTEKIKIKLYHKI